ncbi:unnamed protein product [Nezara viridula]|uniref:Uncharacterized protein n=1 Tax=Nezara viridula TaxID=85310 RepID=A0A9P0GV38_NEZVI|nr:unnamed protein product [Nezara viridula]
MGKYTEHTTAHYVMSFRWKAVYSISITKWFSSIVKTSAVPLLKQMARKPRRMTASPHWVSCCHWLVPSLVILI